METYPAFIKFYLAFVDIKKVKINIHKIMDKMVILIFFYIVSCYFYYFGIDRNIIN